MECEIWNQVALGDCVPVEGLKGFNKFIEESASGGWNFLLVHGHGLVSGSVAGWRLTFDMSGGAKGAKRPLGRPLDGRVSPPAACVRIQALLQFRMRRMALSAGLEALTLSLPALFTL